MSEIAVRAEGLGKRYRIGQARRRADTLGEVMMNVLKAPVRNLQRLRNATRHDDANASDVVWALRDVSFELPEGEVLGIVGRNGAGKSTLLKVLTRITRPTTGRAVVTGHVGSLLEVGTGFHNELTGRENIFLNGAILGMDRSYIANHFDEIVEFSGIERFIDTPVKRYSSGMKVRLAFAVAAHLQPEVLIIDEVLAVGDAAFQKKCLGKMHDVASGGRTVLFVSHNMAAVRSLCSRCLLIDNGSVLTDGPADAVVQRYLDLFEEVDAGPTPTSIAGEPGFGRDYVLHYTDTAPRVSMACGEPLVLRFDLQAPKPLSRATIDIRVVNAAGEIVLGMSNKVQNVPSAPGRSERWRVRCDLGRIPLNAGTYAIRVQAGDGVSDFARFAHAFTIQVLENDVFGWGKGLPPPRVWGAVFWAPSWDIRPA